MAICSTYNAEFDGISVEYVLHDAMGNICEYLNAKDLCHVAQVCKSWHAAALREADKRCYIQRLRLPHNLEDVAKPSATFHVSDVLKVKPHVALLFLGSKLREENRLNLHCISSLESEILSFYKRQFPHKLIGLEVREFLTDEDVTFSCPDLLNHFALESAANNGILGLFLPMHRRANIHVAWCRSHNGVISETAERMVRNLDFGDSQRPRSTLIVFAHSLKGYFIADQVIRIIRNRYQDNRETIWGGIFNKELVAINCEKDKIKSGQKSFVGLRISGPSLDSWSTIIDCSRKRQEVDQKLRDFKARILRKRRTMGLVYGPRKTRAHRVQKNIYHESHELMRAIKRIIPSIPFVGLFNRDCRILFGDDSVDEDFNQKLDHHMYMTMIVLTSD